MTEEDLILRGRGHGLSDAYRGVTEERVVLEGAQILPTGTPYVSFETQNFGWVVFSDKARDVNGKPLKHSLYKY